LLVRTIGNEPRTVIAEGILWCAAVAVLGPRERRRGDGR